MPRGKPLFLVEGDLEKEFLQDICGEKSKVLKIQNGKTVSPAAIAKQVNALTKAIHIQPSYVTVIADREKRTESADVIEQLVSNNLNELGLDVPFSVHVPDKMIENWILADHELIAREQLNINTENGCEGLHGKSELEKAFKEKKLNYKERIDGVRLLKASSAGNIRSNSPSFERLMNTLGPILNSCYWLNK